jgi:hypothetical protein
MYQKPKPTKETLYRWADVLGNIGQEIILHETHIEPTQMETYKEIHEVILHMLDEAEKKEGG